MAEPLGTVEFLVRELARAFTPLRDRLTSGNVLYFFAELGLRFPPQLAANAPFTAALNTAATAAAELPPLVQTLIQAVEVEDVAVILETATDIIEKLQELIPALDTIATQLDALAPALPGMVAGEVQAFAANLPERLIDYVILQYLESYYPILFHSLQLLGIAERAPQPGGGDTTHPPFLLRKIRFHRVGELLNAPEELMRTLYGWGDPGFTGVLLLERLHTVLHSFAAPVEYIPAIGATPPHLDLLFFTLRPKTDIAPKGLELLAEEDFPADIAVETPIFSPAWKTGVRIKSALTAGISTWIQPPLEVTIHPPLVEFEGDFEAYLRGSSPGSEPKFRVFGKQDGTRLEAAEVKAGFFGLFRWDSSNNAAEGDFGIEAKIDQGSLIIDLAGSDGFLTSILPPEGFAFNFDFGVGYTGERGLYFSGSAGLETAISLHAAIGPVTLDTLYLALKAGASGIDVEISIAGSLAIGPVAASVDRLGVLAKLEFQRGNLGPMNLTFAFKPPNGIGVVVSAGPVVGGGYLFLDYERGRYAGVLQLEFGGIALQAIGLLDTKLPGGAPGYSFLIIISAQFSPIQLGYGFTLNGVGGLAGIHRTIVTAALQAGVRTGAVDHILFPEDPVANATRIISDLQAFFPPLQNHYIFGPMALIGWGTPTLLTIELGIILELPAPIRIILLGQLSAALPKPDAAVVELHIDILGILDFGGKFFSLDGTLHDSRVAAFTLWGDMAVRLSWGEQPNFAMSVGGLHPLFQPPPNFPVLRRLTLALGDSDNPRITLQCYMAVTSNSVQFGARAELYAKAAGFNIYGFVGFDVLVIFSPFSFRADLEGGVALRRGTRRIAGIHVHATLTGPTPWHAWGRARFSVLFFSVSVGFDVTFGEERRDELPPAEIWPPLRAALQDARNWSAALPAATARVVSYRELPAPAPVLVDPMGTITVRQTVAPLNRTLEKFGEARPSGTNRFDLNRIAIGTQTLSGWSPVKEFFAPGHFEDLSEDEKLSRSSFDKMDAGASLSAANVKAGTPVGTEVKYETIIVDSAWESHAGGTYILPARVQNALLQIGAAAVGGIRNSGLERFVTPGAATKVNLDDEEFVIVSGDDLSMRNDIAIASTRTDAFSALSRHLAANPEDRGRLIVVPKHEAELAA